MGTKGLAFLSLAALLACKAKPPEQPPPAAVRVATDLPPPVVDTILRTIAQNGGPVAERIPGLSLGAAVLHEPDGGAAAATASGAEGGDVRWDLEPYGAIAAAQRGELLPMPSTGKDVPDLWRDPGGTWVAVGGRAEVLLVALDLLAGRPEPLRFTALTEPWLKGKAAIAAPTGGPSLAHFAALYQAWGEERMQAWLDGLERNQAQVLADDDAVRQAVVTGAAIVGILASDEAAKAAASAARVEVVYPNQRSIGTFVWPTALSVPKSTRRAEAARRLAERLADKSTEQLLVARAPGFLPLRPGIPVPPGVTGAPNLVVISIDPAHIVDEIGRRKAQLADWTQRMQKRAATSSR